MKDHELIRIALPQAERPAPSSAKRRPSALGRGLGALIGETRREEPVAAPAAASARAALASAPAAAEGGLSLLAVSDIEPHPSQPRRHFDEAALDELAQSIAARGVIQPIIVRPLPSGRYQLVAGERRWRAAQRARLHEIPALVRALDEREVMTLALIENLQREDLSPVEEAHAYQRLSEEEGLSQAEIAKMVDKSRSHIANLMRLLALPGEVQAMLGDGRLSMGHARALINVPDPAALAKEAATRGLSVREVERLARKASRQGSGDGGEPTVRRARSDRDPAGSSDIAAVQSHLEDFLGLKVTINAEADPRSGSITLRYRTLDQLDLICQRLTGGGI
jgi:ParB family transcriptional regulator, chromosome partitioning protein